MIKLFSGEEIPMELHKAKIIQKLSTRTIGERVKSVKEAGFNTFLLRSNDVFLDMLTDSGVNAMSDQQQASMLVAVDSYAGSESFYKFEAKLQDVFGLEFILPVHQGRACENLISKVLVTEGGIVPMNYHFTTSKAHVVINGGSIVELIIDEGLEVTSDNPFKGNMDLEKLNQFIKETGRENIPFVRMEAGTNLIGGQPVSLKNFKEVGAICKEHDIPLVVDASLLGDNLHFIHKREEACADMSIKDICREIGKVSDIIYFSARKFGSARGGGMCIKSEKMFDAFKELLTLYEGFLTYGGMSVMEIEATTMGIEETMNEDVIAQGPEFIEFMVNELQKKGVPVVTPAGGLGCHLDAKAFLSHIPQEEYPAGALASALYIISGIRGMERGTISEDRKPDGSDTLAKLELLRLAVPRRVFSLSHIKFVVDRVVWLFENRELIGGLEFTDEPDILRFFFGKLAPTSDWVEQLSSKFEKDFNALENSN